MIALFRDPAPGSPRLDGPWRSQSLRRALFGGARAGGTLDFWIEIGQHALRAAGAAAGAAGEITVGLGHRHVHTIEDHRLPVTMQPGEAGGELSVGRAPPRRGPPASARGGSPAGAMEAAARERRASPGSD